MDTIDRKILAVLQEDASRSVADIGKDVGLSATPCWKRIQKLEAEGVIQKRVALVDQNKVGLGITVFVSIEAGDHSAEWRGRNFLMREQLFFLRFLPGEHETPKQYARLRPRASARNQ